MIHPPSKIWQHWVKRGLRRVRKSKEQIAINPLEGMAVVTYQGELPEMHHPVVRSSVTTPPPPPPPHIRHLRSVGHQSPRRRLWGEVMARPLLGMQSWSSQVFNQSLAHWKPMVIWGESSNNSVIQMLCAGRFSLLGDVGAMGTWVSWGAWAHLMARMAASDVLHTAMVSKCF